MGAVKLAKACPLVKIFGRMLVDFTDEAIVFRTAISDFLCESEVSLSRLSLASGGGKTGGANIAKFIDGFCRISPQRALAIAVAIDRYPAAWPSMRHGAFSQGPSVGDVGAAPLFLRNEAHIAEMREAAAARRAAHIESCRQAAIERYGFTTINGDVMDMAA